MDDKDEKLRTQLIEAILEYLEGENTLQSVFTLGTTATNRNKFPIHTKVTEVASQLDAMGDEAANGKSFSREYIKDVFTTMLEKLISD